MILPPYFSVVGGALSGEAKRYFETGRILDDMTEAAGAGSMGPPVTARPPFPSPIAGTGYLSFMVY